MANGLWSGSNLRYDGQKVVDGYQQKEQHALVENDADQSNEELCQDAKNKPFAGVHNKNKNFNPQFGLLFANNSSRTGSRTRRGSTRARMPRLRRPMSCGRASR